MIPAPDAFETQVRLFVARWLTMYPQDADLSDDDLRRIAADVIIERSRRDVPKVFLDAFAE